MNTLIYVGLIACVCMAYASALPEQPSKADDLESYDTLKINEEPLVDAGDRLVRSPNHRGGGHGGGYGGGYGGGHGGGRGHGGGHGYGR